MGTKWVVGIEQIDEWEEARALVREMQERGYVAFYDCAKPTERLELVPIREEAKVP